MATRRMAVRRLEEEGEHEEIPQGRLDPQGVKVTQDAQVPPQGDQVPLGGEGNEDTVVPPDMTNRQIREALLSLVRTMTTHVNRGIEPMVNAIESTMTSRLRDFVRMNPPIFFGSNVGEDSQEFLDVV